MTWVIRQGTRCRRLNHHGRIKLDHKVSGAITTDRPGSTRATYRPDSKSTSTASVQKVSTPLAAVTADRLADEATPDSQREPHREQHDTCEPDGRP